MKKAWIIVILIVVVGGGGGAVVLSQLVKQRGASARVNLAKAERSDLVAIVSAPGKVEAAASVDISAEVPGRIVELTVEEGEIVEQGQLLLRLDDTRYRSQLEQAQASMRSARANLELSEARLDKARADLERQESLLAGGLASEETVERYRTDFRIASAEAEARRQDLVRVDAAITQARDDLGKTVYRSPLTGLVSRLNIEAGENVVIGTMNNPGTVILTISDMSVLEVVAEVDETDVVDVAVGQEAVITVDALPDEEFPATVVTVGNSGRSASRGSAEQVVFFEVRVRFDAADPRLRPGMTADVDIRTERREDVLTVPIQALVARSRATLRGDLEAAEEEAGRYTPPDSLEGDDRDAWDREILEGVYRSADGRARFVEVTTGIADQTRIELREIHGELSPGDEVVSGPYRTLRDLKEGTRLRGSGRDEANQDDG